MAKDRPGTTMSLSIPCRVSREATGSLPQSCPSCCDPLELHQPDQEQPDRLLGTCPGCLAWFVIDRNGDAPEYLLLRVPTPKELKQAVPRPVVVADRISGGPRPSSS